MFTRDLVAGDTLAINWQFLADPIPPATVGLPLDLTGCSAVFSVVGVTTGTTVAQFSTSDTNPVLTTPSPYNMVVLAANATSNIPPGLYFISLKISFPIGEAFTYDQENLLVTAGPASA